MIRGFFKGICCVVLAVVLGAIGVNGWVVLSAKGDIVTFDELSAEGPYDAIVVLGASVNPDGSLSSILENRMDAAVRAYFDGVAPVIIVSGDGREANYDEPAAMKRYAVSQGVPADAVYCDGGGYHTYDTMWRVANVYGAQRVAVITQEYHLYRAVFDARGAGMDAVGAVSDSGTYEDQLYYDARECAARIQDAWCVATGAAPDNAAEPIAL